MCSGRLSTTATLLLEILVAVALGGPAGVLLFGELGFVLTGTPHWAIGLLLGPFVAFAIIRSVRRP